MFPILSPVLFRLAPRPEQTDTMETSEPLIIAAGVYCLVGAFLYAIEIGVHCYHAWNFFFGGNEDIASVATPPPPYRTPTPAPTTPSRRQALSRFSNFSHLSSNLW